MRYVLAATLEATPFLRLTYLWWMFEDLAPSDIGYGKISKPFSKATAQARLSETELIDSSRAGPGRLGLS